MIELKSVASMQEFSDAYGCDLFFCKMPHVDLMDLAIEEYALIFEVFLVIKL